MKRRTFLIEAGKAFPVLAGARYLVGCDSSNGLYSNASDNTSGAMVIRATSSVAAGHTHTAEVPVADLNRTTDKTYTSSRAAGHTHNVTLSAAQLGRLRDGEAVTVTSSSDAGHLHQFTFQQA